MSFFGSKPKQIDIALDSCDSYSKELFEAAELSVVKRCGPIVERLSSSLENFKSAISEFSKITKDPDEEFAERMSISFIKTQKPKYEEALTNAATWLSEAINSINYETKYENLRALQASYADFVSRVLSVNANFKGVVMGYSDEMRFFKKPFASMEKAQKDLEYELDKGTEQFRFYTSLKDEIEKERLLQNDLHAYFDSGETMIQKDLDSKKISNEKIKLEQTLSEINAKISDLEKNYQAIKAEIAQILKPLERPSRKYDHSRTRGASLVQQIDSPIEELSSELSYSNFVAMLKDMRSKISNGEIKIDDSKQVTEQINDALNSGLDSIISEANSITNEIQNLRGEIKIHNDILYEAKKKINNIESKAQMQRSIEERCADIESQIQNTKYSIERMFAQYYNITVHIKD